jgi:sugar transferase (PEP-CTERM system associated)
MKQFSQVVGKWRAARAGSAQGGASQSAALRLQPSGLASFAIPERFRLFNRYWKTPAAACLLIESGLLYLSVWAAYQLRFASGGYFPYEGAAFRLRALTIVAVILSSLYLHRLYDFKLPRGKRREFMLLLRAFFFSTLGLSALYYFVPSLWMGRGLFGLSIGIGGLCLVGSRVLLRLVLNNNMFSERVLIVGRGHAATELAREILQHSHLGYEVLGFISGNGNGGTATADEPPVLGSCHDACRLARSLQATRVIVAELDQRGQLALDDLLDCEAFGVPVVRSSAYYEELTGKILLDGPRVKSWLLFSGGLTVPRTVLLPKRLLDLAVAALGLVVAAPLLFLAALAIKLESRGPVLYRQRRVGLQSRSFEILKLRSMVDGAEAGTGPRWAEQNDQRVTRVGRLLRRSHLDELPQLWNILRGDMSLVGPRPERPELVDRINAFCPLYQKRFGVRPGLTGWAQIMAPYAASIEESKEKVKYDLYYIKNLSFFLDVSILASTARTVILGTGAR